MATDLKNLFTTTAPTPSTPFAATGLGLAANTAGGLSVPGAVGTLADLFTGKQDSYDPTQGTLYNTILGLPNAFKETIVQPFARAFGTAFTGLGELFGGASTLTANDVPEAIRPAWKQLFGDEPIKDFAGRVSDAENDITSSPFAQKYGYDKYAFPLAFGGIAADEALNFIGLGGSEGKFIDMLVKESDPEIILRHLIDAGVNPVVAEKFAPNFAAATSRGDVKDLFNLVRSTAGLEALKTKFENPIETPKSEPTTGFDAQGFRPVVKDEILPPGYTTKMNVTTGEQVTNAPIKAASRGSTNVMQLQGMLDREERSLAAARENPEGHAKAYGPGKVEQYQTKIAELKSRIAKETGVVLDQEPIMKDLYHRQMEIDLKQEALNNSPLKEMLSHVATRGDFKGELSEEFTTKGGNSLDQYASDLGYGSSEELRAAMRDYIAQRKDLADARKALGPARREAVQTILATRQRNGTTKNLDAFAQARETANAARKELGLPPLTEKDQQAFQGLRSAVEGKPESNILPKGSTSYRESITGTPQNRQEAKAAAQADQREMASLQDTFDQSTNEVKPGDTRAVKRTQYDELTNDVTSYKDISGFQGQARDVFRTFKAFFGKNFSKVKEKILDPFDAAKGQYIDTQKFEADELKREIVDKLGIKQGSRESAAVMDFGEKTLTEEDLRARFRPAQVERIMAAEKWFRAKYDDLLERVNESRREIYGDVKSKKRQIDNEIDVLEAKIAGKEKELAAKTRPDTIAFSKLQSQIERLDNAKIKRLDLLNSDAWWRGKVIEKRKDYFHHFKDLEGVEGLKNIFETPAGISPTLSGISEYTKPKSKFLSFAQARLGLATKHDAVGGLLHYIPSYSYAVHIDPHIGKFRKLADELGAASEKNDTQNANNMIEFLHDYANDLAGKTNPADRYIQKLVPGGRKTMQVIDWVNKRVKANTILGNLSSSISQIFNVPQGIASAKQYSIHGVTRTLGSIFAENKPMAESNFIKERYFSSYFDKFDDKMLAKPKQFAVWMTGVLDELGTKFIWNSQYAKALGKGIANPVKYADDETRALVAGRGIGEVPLIHKSKITQIIAPFQLEVGNLWYVMGDMVKKKDFAGLATLFVANYLFNNVAENLVGHRVTFDPLKAVYEGFKSFEGDKDKGRGAEKFGGRLAGEVLANVPGGQSLASLYPEYGFSGLGKKNLSRKDLFGNANPVRSGSGLLSVGGLQDPLFKIIPPFGGGQIKKSLQGVAAYEKGKDTTPTGKTRFKIKRTPENLLRVLLFGKSALPEAQNYYNHQANPKSTSLTSLF